MRKGNVIERSGVNVARGAWVKALEFGYDVWRVDVLVDHPGITTDVVALNLTRYSRWFQRMRMSSMASTLCSSLPSTMRTRREWGFRASADDRVRNSPSELDDGKDQMHLVGALDGMCHVQHELQLDRGPDNVG
jgi:hypothetical protein